MSTNPEFTSIDRASDDVKIYSHQEVAQLKLHDFLSDLYEAKGKLLSITLGALYLVPNFLFGTTESTIKIALFLVITLGLIWFPEVFGRHRGSTSAIGGSVAKLITKVSPTSIVRFMGWVLLLSPAFNAIIFVILSG